MVTFALLSFFIFSFNFIEYKNVDLNEFFNFENMQKFKIICEVTIWKFKRRKLKHIQCSV